MTLANLWGWVFPALTWMLAFGWLWQMFQWLVHFPELDDLNRLAQNDLALAPIPKSEDTDSPQLTVVVPACNEEAAVEATVRSLLASVGVRLQIIAVDDRSTDRTGEILDRVLSEVVPASNGHTLQVLHITELPQGWLGKPHAVATAAGLARAEWILFTDGDVAFGPEAASLGLRYALEKQADHLVLMPDWTMKSVGEAAMHGAMHALSTWTMHLWRVADPKAKDFLGVGAFNLVRRSTYEALGGFADLRMEVVEDMRFGWKLKRAGFRSQVVLGAGLASVRWSNGAWGVVRNLEKNLFALYRFNVPLSLLACLGLAVQIALPIAAIVHGGWARVGGVVIYGAIAGVYVASRTVTRVGPWYVVFFPFAATLFLFAMLRSMTLALARGGVMWRGTLYSLKELRTHAGELW